MKQLSRLLTLTLIGGFLFTLGILGWLELCERVAEFIPTLEPIASSSFMRGCSVFVGLALLLLPFYVLLYFHQTKHSEVLGFKTPRVYTTAKPADVVNPSPRVTDPERSI